MSDVSSELSELIASAKTFGNSDNIRVGRYKFAIKRVFAEKVESGRFAFAELRVLESQPNPQIMPAGVNPAKFDDGTRPNLVGSDCAMKVNFDGPGGKSAPGNVKSFVLGLFGMSQGDTSEADVNSTWKDLTRLHDNKNNDGTPAEAKKANPACGMVISCTASMKEKKKTKLLPADQKEFVTILNWECTAKPGVGENSKDLVAARRAEVETASVSDDEVDDTPSVPATAPATTVPATAAPAIPAAPVAPPAPPAVKSYLDGWTAHPTAPGFFYRGQQVFTEAQLAAGAGKAS